MVDSYLSLATAVSLPEDINTANYGLLSLPLYFNLREHHCISPSWPAPPGGELIDISHLRRSTANQAAGGESNHENNDEDEDAEDFLAFDEGLMNGWFSEGINMVERNGEVRLTDGGETYTYTTWAEGKSMHDPDTCEVCEADRERQRLEELERREAREREEKGDEGEQGEQGPGGAASRGSTGGRPGTARRVFGRRLASASSVPSSPSPLSPEASSLMAVDRSETDASQEHDVSMHDAEQTNEDEDENENEAEIANLDNMSDYSDIVSNTCNGVMDIIITGEVRCSFAFPHFPFVSLSPH